jgi:hypothetical protein
MTNWRRIRAFSLADWGLIGWAALLLAVTRWSLPLIRFRVAGSPFPGEGLPPEPRERAERVARMVGIASRHGIVEVTCLHRALVLWWILGRRGIACRLRLGTRHRPGPFEAHAWIECGGVPIGESSTHLATFDAFERAVTPSFPLISPRSEPGSPRFDPGTKARFGP